MHRFAFWHLSLNLPLSSIGCVCCTVFVFSPVDMEAEDRKDTDRLIEGPSGKKEI